MAKMFCGLGKGGLIAMDEESQELFKKLKAGVVYQVEVKQKRNYRFLKKYFKLLKLAFDNQDQFTNFDWFRTFTLLGVGHCDTMIGSNGELHYQVKSISFDRCTSQEFDDLYNKTLTLLIAKYGFDNSFVDELLSYGG